MSHLCKCGHSEAWHIGEYAGGRFTQNRTCAWDGCRCAEFRNEDVA